MSRKSSKISDSTKEEANLGIANYAAAEEHLIEVVGKTNDPDLKQYCRKMNDGIRRIRQEIATSVCMRK